MAKISKLEMAASLASRNDITLERTCFGLCEKCTYTPTGSRLHALKADYAPEALSRLERLLAAAEGHAAEVAAGLKLERMAVGNVRVEACLADDGAFAAVQLLRFTDYLYRPVDAPRFFTGADAKAVADLLRR